MTDIFKNEIRNGLFSACQFCTIDNSFKIDQGYLGTMSFDNHEKISLTTFFDIASITKIILVTPLYYYIFSKNSVLPTNRVSDFIHDFKTSVTLLELINHTSGFQAWLPFYELAADFTEVKSRKQKVIEIIDKSEKLEKTYRYSDLNFILLGFILEKIYGTTLDLIFDNFRKEVGISSDITFFPQSQVPLTAFSKLRNAFPDRTVEDENCYFLGGMTGHAGLFSSAKEAASYFRNLIEKEWFIKTAERLNFAGFDRPSGDDSNYGRRADSHFIGHLGFTGTALLIDTFSLTVSALFTNSTHPSPDKPDRKERLKKCRQQFFDSVIRH